MDLTYKIFVADIGNSYSKIAILDSDLNVLSKVYIKTLPFFTNSYLKQQFMNLKQDHKVVGSIIGSVVERHTKVFARMAKSVFNVDSYLINQDTLLNFTMNNVKTNEVGQDILALAQYCSYKNPNSIGFSFGTAMFGLCLYNNNLEGVSISIGLGTSVETLINRVEKLKGAEINKTKNTFYGIDTLSSLESGINNLRSGFVSNFYGRAIKTHNASNFYCVLSGGEAHKIDVDINYEINVNAILIGYAIIFFDNQKIFNWKYHEGKQND